MDFCNAIKNIRNEHNLTQEELAAELHVTRQAISNWENEKNLPDIEMVIRIAKTFNVSLDELIFGGKETMTLEEKLIKDGSDTQRAKYNMVSFIIGAVLLLLGSACIGIKAVSPEYFDAEGILHENFFLLPTGFAFILSGMIAFVISAVKNVKELFGNKEEKSNCTKGILLSTVSAVVMILLIAAFCLLISANR